MAGPCRVLLISGSLRTRSTTTAVLRTAAELAPSGVSADLYEGAGDLPPFNPDDDAEPLHPAVAAMRSGIRASDAILFSTPEYAGGLPGPFKNLLDWTIGDDRAGSIHGKPVAWINASPRVASGAHRVLRSVLGFAGASVVEQACVHIPVTAAMLDDGRAIAVPAIRDQVATAVAALVEEARGAG